jgi:putative PIN family toxin of toxin-antitoxin system
VRVVLDTNVLLSAMFTRGVCEALLDAAIESDAFAIVLSDHILKGFERHARDKFAAPPAEVAAAVDFLRRSAEIVAPARLPSRTCRDRSDLPALGTAVAANADALVTGDADLLGLVAIRGIPICSPRSFYDRLR